MTIHQERKTGTVSRFQVDCSIPSFEEWYVGSYSITDFEVPGDEQFFTAILQIVKSNRNIADTDDLSQELSRPESNFRCVRTDCIYWT